MHLVSKSASAAACTTRISNVSTGRAGVIDALMAWLERTGASLTRSHVQTKHARNRPRLLCFQRMRPSIAAMFGGQSIVFDALSACQTLIQCHDSTSKSHGAEGLYSITEGSEAGRTCGLDPIHHYDDDQGLDDRKEQQQLEFLVDNPDQPSGLKFKLPRRARATVRDSRSQHVILRSIEHHVTQLGPST